LAEELHEVIVLRREIPVEPADRVILTVRVVVAALRPSELVAAEQHWRARSEEQRARVILHELPPKSEHSRVRGFPLGTAVPGIFVLGPVFIVLAVPFVVLLIVRDEVVQREAVMAGDEVNTVVRRPAIIAVKIRRAGEPPAEIRELAGVAFLEA